MSSQEAVEPAPPNEAKANESPAPKTDAPEPEGSASTPTPATPSTANLTKRDYEVMSRVVKFLTEYKNEEYVYPSVLYTSYY